MQNWRLTIPDEQADKFAYLFYLLGELDLLSHPNVEPSTKHEIAELSEWYTEAYELRKAKVAVRQKFGR